MIKLFIDKYLFRDLNVQYIEFIYFKLSFERKVRGYLYSFT